jgi:CHAT domain-containing protein
VRASELPSAWYEAMTVLSGFGTEATVVRCGEATRLAFRREAPRATVLHLACHGYADLADPLDSSLLLAGGPVTLRDLLEEYRLQVRLAVLSACEWRAMAGQRWLPAEVAEYFEAAMLGHEPDGRAHQDIHMWAAFTHVGA